MAPQKGPWSQYQTDPQPSPQTTAGPWNSYSSPDSLSINNKQAQDATDALVYSNLISQKPSFTYDNHDAIQESFGERLGDWGKAGWAGITKDSIIGELWQGGISAPVAKDEVGKWVEGFGQMVGDLPVYLAGQAAGKWVGAASATGIAGPEAAPLGAAIGGGAGGFGLTMAMRQMLVNHYVKGDVLSFEGLVDILKAGGKGALTGGAMGLAGELTPLAGGPIAKYASPKLYKGAAELATMTTVGSLLEGKVPSLHDFASNAAMFAAMHIGTAGFDFAKESMPALRDKMFTLYSRDAMHPSEVTEEGAKRSVAESVTDNPMEILNRIDNEIGSIPQAEEAETQEQVAPPPPTQDASTPPPPVGERETSIKNDVTETEREERGLSPVEVEARQTPAFEAAKKAVDAGTIRPRELAEELAANPRPHTDEEAGALLYDRMRLQNEHAQVMNGIEDAREKGDTDREQRERKKLTGIEDSIDKNDQAARLSGTETGRALNARRMMVKQDYSLSATLQRARVASKDGNVSPEVRGRLEDLTRQLEDANKKMDEYEESKRQSTAQQAVDKIARTTKRAATKEKLGTEYDDLVKQLNAELLGKTFANPMLNPKLYELFGKLAANRIHSGIVTIEGIVDDIHDKIKESGISKREIRDYISKYGREAKEPTKNEVQAQLREAQKQGKLISAIEDAQAGEEPQKGKAPGKPSERVKELRKQLDAAMKSEEPLPEEPKEKEPKAAGDVSGRESARQKAVEKSISELDRRIKAKDMSPSQRLQGPDTETLDSLKEQRDSLRETFEQMKKEGVDKGGGKERARAQAIQKTIADLDRRISSGDTSPAAKRQGADTEEISKLKEQRDALRKQFEEIKDASTDKGGGKEQARAKALQKSIDDLEDRIKRGDTSAKTRMQGPDTEQASTLKARRDALRETLDSMKKSEREAQDPEAIKLKAYKTRTSNRIRELQSQLDSGDFSKPTRKQLVLDQQAEDLRAQSEKLKGQVDDAIQKQKDAARSPVEKGAAMFLKWRRAVLLSSVGTLGKLQVAAMARFGTTPIEELLGGVLSKIPGISDIAEKAPREGGLNLSAEAKAFGQFFEKATYSDIREAVKTGKSSLDYLYGKKSNLPPEAIEFFGHLHSAIKVLPKRAEFYRSLEKRAQWALDNHLDIEDPKVQATIAADAYIDANRAIFMQDNFFTDAYKAMIHRLEKGGLSGKSVAFMMNVVLPIVKVPTNIVGEMNTLTTGAVTGSIRALKVLTEKGGLDNLTMHDADNILRSLKKGSMGLAVLAMGYAAGSATSSFIRSSGFYQPGDEKKTEKPETLTVGGVDISWILHTPVGAVFEMGATMRRVNEAYTVKGKSGGLVAGVAAGALGATKKVPFIEEAARLGDAVRSPDTAGLFVDDLIASLLVPPDVRKIAKAIDPTPRKPTNLMQTIESQVPGMTKDVPIKKKGKKFSIRGSKR